MNAGNEEYREVDPGARRFFLLASIFFIASGLFLLRLRKYFFSDETDNIVVLIILWGSASLFSVLSIYFARLCYLSIKAGIFPAPDSRLPARHRIYNDRRVILFQWLTAIICLFHIVFALLIVEFIFRNY
jgi:hypothetical protein